MQLHEETYLQAEQELSMMTCPLGKNSLWDSFDELKIKKSADLSRQRRVQLHFTIAQIDFFN